MASYYPSPAIRALTEKPKMATRQSIREEDRDSLNQIVAVVLGKKVTRRELMAAFSLVEPKDNWKNAIDAEVVLGTDRASLMVREAVTFFTGSTPRIEFVRVLRPITGTEPGASVYRVRAAGYYATVGA
jgi:hypothetical protein